MLFFGDQKVKFPGLGYWSMHIDVWINQRMKASYILN